MASIFDTVTDFLKSTISTLNIDNKINIKQFNDTVVNDYFRTYLFQVIITDGGTNTVSLLTSNLTTTLTNIIPNINTVTSGFQCEWIATTATPVMTTTTQNVDYLHTQVRQAGRTTPQQWQVTVRDDANGKAFKYFNDWRNTVYPNIESTTPARYKKTADVKLIPPTGSSQVRLYRLYGVWPFELGSVALDYDQNNICVFPVTLSFDFFEVQGIGA